MKGILFNLLEGVVVDSYGIDVWDQMIDRARVGGSYTAVGNYDDAELGALTSSLGDLCSAARGTTTEPDVLRWFGRSGMAPLAERYPGFFTPHSASLDFVLTLNDVIHAEVLKLHPAAAVPTFHFSAVRRDGETSSVTLHYSSDRLMCALAEGFIAGAALHYGETVSITQPVCMLDGHDECQIACEFERLPTDPAAA